MILHIPHSSIDIPDEYINEYINHTSALHYLTDYYTDELFNHWNSTRVVYNKSRLFCDVERFRNDPLEKIGQGIVYTKFQDKTIRVISSEHAASSEKASLDDYNKHHKKLTDVTNRLLSLQEVVVCVDCHSFHPDVSDLDFCIGYNTDTTNTEMKDLSEEIKTIITGYSVGINDPFQGAIVPYTKESDENVRSIMIEVNKKLYTTKESNYTEKSKDFILILSIINKILDIVSKYETRNGYETKDDTL